MYIRLSKGSTAKKTKVYLVEGYRDENGKSKQRIIKKYGNLEDLEAKDPNILEKLRARAKEIPKNEVKITLNLSDSNTEKEKDKNYGYFFLENIYNALEIPEFLRNFSFEKNYRYNIDEVMKLLVFGRILKPGSKNKTFDERDEYFTPFKCSMDSIDQSLTQMDEIKEDLQVHLNRKVSETYGREASLVFYNVTNYFETDIKDEFKKKSVPKDKKTTPLVEMGLLIDEKGLPIAYQLFPGHANDRNTLIHFLADVREKYKLERIMLMTDKGFNSGKNLTNLLSKGDGYIFSQKVRDSSKKFIKEVLDEEDYVSNLSNTFKIKSFIRERRVKNEWGEYETIKEKCVCFWSKNDNNCEKLEEGLKEYLNNPLKYIKGHTVEIKDMEPVLSFEKNKYESDVALDGYYVLISSELEMTNAEIIEKYKGLLKIEEHFRVIKSELEGGPVDVTRKDDIEAHFLICFIALHIIRILEMKLDYEHNIKSIRDSLKNATCRKVERSIYSLNKQGEVFRAIEKAFDVSLDFKHVRIEQLREYKRKITNNLIN